MRLKNIDRKNSIPLHIVPRIFFVLAMLTVVCGCNPLKSPSIGELNRMIETEIPKGSTRGDVIRFLDKRHIPYTLSKQGSHIEGIQKDLLKSPANAIHIGVTFDFNDAGLLQSFATKELFHAQ